jgi:5-methylcytosine-specific restriction endonuclease McrA
MTREEFLDTRDQLACQACGHVGLDADHNANNGGMRASCPSCPWRGQWLPKGSRRPRRGPVNTDEVWSANGDHCAFCGKSRALCESLKIGLSAQHVVPFAVAGDAWPLVPFCARCQQASTAALAETQRLEQYLEARERNVAELKATIARIEKLRPELVE